MNVFEKIIEKLEELQEENTCGYCRYRKKCNEVQEKVSVATDLCGATMKALAIEIVKEVAAEHNDGWIPLGKGLPACGKYILLSFENFSVPQVGRYEEDENGEGKFYIGDEEKSCMSQDLFVNAWQPLPEVYVESGKCVGYSAEEQS